ncbi:MAG: hypothetical protein AB8F95_08625 [Bacteroidia bacterium]
MKAKETYLKGQSIFIVSLIVIALVTLTVYFTGIHVGRTVTTNFYMSLGIVGSCLFFFMTFGLYRGVKLVDNFPDFKKYEMGDLVSSSGSVPELPIPDGGGLGEFLVGIVMWIVMTIAVFVMLIVFEFVLWMSLFVLILMLYWVFFRALKYVFSKKDDTRGKLGLSALYALSYTILYTGWMFGVVYMAEFFR